MGNKQAWQRLPEQKIKGLDFAFILDDDMVERQRQLISKGVPANDKAKIMRQLYANGIVGREPGTNNKFDALRGRGRLTDAQYILKQQIIQSVNSGELFSSLKGNTEIPSWVSNVDQIMHFSRNKRKSYEQLKLTMTIDDFSF